ncbi:MAG: DUF6264 family protein [Leucobacter sp.]
MTAERENENGAAPRSAPRYGEHAPDPAQQESAPEAPPASQPGAAGAAGRPAEAAKPAPEYGEYAPEGWSWSPDDGKPASEASTPAAAPARSGQLPGIPHNLGVETAADPHPAPPSDQPTSYRAAQPPQDRAPAQSRGLADRIITIVLLAVGAYGALSFAFSLQELPRQLRLAGSMLGLENLAVPGSVGTIGVVGAIIVLAIYAVNLIFSIQRMRARKLAFWIPLVAFALALVVVFVCTAIAVSQIPELLQQASDPDALERLLNSMSTPTP